MGWPAALVRQLPGGAVGKKAKVLEWQRSRRLTQITAMITPTPRMG